MQLLHESCNMTHRSICHSIWVPTGIVAFLATSGLHLEWAVLAGNGGDEGLDLVLQGERQDAQGNVHRDGILCVWGSERPIRVGGLPWPRLLGSVCRDFGQV